MISLNLEPLQTLHFEILEYVMRAFLLLVEKQQ